MRVAIIGCGLLGGSFALAYKRARPADELICFDLPQRLAALREAGCADRCATLDQAGELLPGCGLVLLAAPVEKILELLELITPKLTAGTIVTDVGSTKAAIVQRALQVLPASVTFIGGHPMAGAERSGVEAADPLLFNERAWLLCPTPATPADKLLGLIDLVESLRALPVTLEPEEHDRLMAVVSHAPQLLSVALMNAALEADQAHGLLGMVAGRGFLDLTRIAASDFEVWRGILQTNREAILTALERIEQSVVAVREAYAQDRLEPLWTAARERRSKMGLDSLPRPRQADLRKLIDSCDEQIVRALGNRMRAVRRIGRIKAQRGGSIYDPERERQLLEQRADWARALELDPELIQGLFALILNYSKLSQQPKPQG